MKNLLALVIVAFIITTSTLLILYRGAKHEAKRQSENVANLTKEKNQILKITRSEFERSETKWKQKIDSVIKAEGIKLSQIKAATVLETVYRDTGGVKVVYKDPILLPDKEYSIPVTYYTKCWGMVGTITTIDKNAKLDIVERTASNSVQLLITRKRALGFLWWKKGEQYKGYSDCGEVEFTSVTFVKK